MSTRPPTRPATILPPPRSAQDLLAERRANTVELMGERDATARAMLQAHIDGLDRELAARRTPSAPTIPVPACRCRWCRRMVAPRSTGLCPACSATAVAPTLPAPRSSKP